VVRLNVSQTIEDLGGQATLDDIARKANTNEDKLGSGSTSFTYSTTHA
jgi:hypothetical protein